MTHPSLGRPPRDLRAGHPDAVERLRRAGPRLAARALEIALERDPSMAERHGELGLRKLLRDMAGILERLGLALASNDRTTLAEWAEWAAPIYRRRRVPMDDLVQLLEGLRLAGGAVLLPEELDLADGALDEGIRVLRWHRRIAGDARKRNRILDAIYKGA